MKKRIAIAWKSALIVCFSAILTLGCGPEKKEGANTNEKDTTSKIAFDVKNMDKNIKPGDDFYRFVNGGWMKSNPIPDEYSQYGIFEILQNENFDALRAMFEEASSKKGAAKGSIEQKIGDFYSSGMDEKKVNADGIKPLEPIFKKINGISDIKGVQEAIAFFHSNAMYPMFIFFAEQDEKNSEAMAANLYQGGLGLPDRDYYLSDDPRSKQIRDEYVKHVAKMFVLLGDSKEAAQKEAEEIMKLETEIAKVSFTRLDLRDPNKNYNKMTLAELAKFAPGFDWAAYFKNIGIENPGDIIVKQKPFFAGISKLIKKTGVDAWKTYLRWNLVNEYADFLSSDFVNQNFEFYSKTLSGNQKIHPRWKRVLIATSGYLGELVGQLYVKKYFPKEAKDKMLALVGNLKKSLHERITKLEWMSDETKVKALEKLDKMKVKIGYPDKWIDYSALDVSRDSYAMNVMRARNFEFKRNLNKIGKPVDRGEWGMTPQTINAYYHPVMNEIVFPAAILQPPFFNLNADDALNYGAIGTIIGHEMTHGFDDQGRLYDVRGNLNNWWTEEDSKKFKEKTQALIDQFNAFGITLKDTVMNVNGELTLGENIADLGGITVSLNAFKYVMKEGDKTIDGFTPLQRFFLSYAQVWRQNIRDEELMRRLREDVHSPGESRVNGVVGNVPEFYNAFDIKEGGALYRPVDKRAVIW